MKLDHSFYQRPDVTIVAKDLLGKVLCTWQDGKFVAGKIVETEAYSYLEKACHAYNNRRTKRTEVLYENGGTSYVYLCYGIHNLFNIVTNVKGVAEAILVRAVEPLEGVSVMRMRRGNLHGDSTVLTSGPGKLSQAMAIDRTWNKLDLMGDKVWLEDWQMDVPEVESSARIGVGYAGKDALLPWRYTIANSPWVSKGNNAYSV